MPLTFKVKVPAGRESTITNRASAQSKVPTEIKVKKAPAAKASVRANKASKHSKVHKIIKAKGGL